MLRPEELIKKGEKLRDELVKNGVEDIIASISEILQKDKEAWVKMIAYGSIMLKEWEDIIYPVKKEIYSFCGEDIEQSKYELPTLEGSEDSEFRDEVWDQIMKKREVKRRRLGADLSCSKWWTLLSISCP